jgi:threonine dehydratase
MVTPQDIINARERIQTSITVTSLRRSEYLSDLTGGTVLLKLENEQVTGSFKLRGALNKTMILSRREKTNGIITASTGNHGLGIAFAARRLGLKAYVVFPINGSPEKYDKMVQAGATVIQEVGYTDIERYARKLANERNLTYISPYNDPAIVAGAGTVGVELLEQVSHIDTVIVPVGGGGLISGIAVAIKAVSPMTQVIGVQSEVSTEVYESWRAGHWVHVEESESIAQGLMGGVESDSITLDIIQKSVDNILLVRESSILSAMRLLLEREKLVIEGAGAVSVAALIEGKQDFSNKVVVAVISGGNTSAAYIKSLLER